MQTVEQIAEYYRQADQAYQNWGKDTEIEGLYGIHCGYYPAGIEMAHYDAVKELANKLVGFAQIPELGRVADLGCGVGSISFNVARRHPDILVHGANVSLDQLNQANFLKEEHQIPNVNFSLQDYHRLAFGPQTFNTAIFCESFTHSYNKNQLAIEMARILSKKGNLVIADVFISGNKAEPNLDDLQKVCQGWLLPDIVDYLGYLKVLNSAGFKVVEAEDVTEYVYPSFKRMSVHAQMRLDQDMTPTEVIRKSREACVSALNLVDQDAVGYYFIRASKS